MASIIPNSMTKEYISYAKQSKFPPLTNTQQRFAEWLLLEENKKVIEQLGNLNDVFIDVRRFVKSENKK